MQVGTVNCLTGKEKNQATTKRKRNPQVPMDILFFHRTLRVKISVFKSHQLQMEQDAARIDENRRV